MLRILLLIILIICLNEKAFSKTLELCSKHPVFCHIVKNNPNIDLNYAMELSNVIYKLSTAYNINPIRLSAILATESKYKLDAINHKTKDYGIAQINEKTANSYNFCKQKLLTDLEYSVKAGVIVLADFKKAYADKEKDWYCRYNAGTASKDKIKKTCDRYLEAVNKYL